MSTAYETAESLWGDWERDLTAGTPPTRYAVAPAGSPLADLRVGPQQVTLFGGPPGAGKTALVMQLVTDAAVLCPVLRVLIANVEMPPQALLERQLARLTDVPLAAIRDRAVPDEQRAALADGLGRLKAVGPRLGFLSPPFTVEHLASAADEFGADVVVLDYVQRFGVAGSHTSKKAEVDAIMDGMRRFANAGVAVILVAAVGRQRNEKGQTGYGGLSLASFRESSELEYGADDAFLLVGGKDGELLLQHAKSRNGEPKDRSLRFLGGVQRFVAGDGVALIKSPKPKPKPATPPGGEW